jgi:hypothetical protein
MAESFVSGTRTKRRRAWAASGAREGPPEAAEMRTLNWECASFIGGEFDRNSLALFQKLFDVKSLQLESVVMVERRDDQPDVVLGGHPKPANEGHLKTGQ